MKILQIRTPFVDFLAENREIGEDINLALERVFKSGLYILGKEVSGFEKKLASFIGTKYAVGVASGTDALTLAIKSLGLKNTDAVLLPANVYPSVFGVALSGVKIRLCDVDSESLNVTLETIKRVVTKEIKAIVIVHLYGNPVDIEPIEKFAKDRGIYLIEDCAQAAGSIYKGKRVGSFGDISCFSFYPTKNLGAYGDGGAVLTNDKDIFEKVRLLRMYGEKSRYDSIMLGHNSRLDEIQAAILSTKLNFLNKWNDRRHEIAEKYKELLSGLPLKFIEENPEGKSNYHLFVINIKQRGSLMKYLFEKGIASVIHYPVPIHFTKTFSYLGYKKGDFPVSERSSNEVLSLPIYPQMEFDTVTYIAGVIKSFFESRR